MSTGTLSEWFARRWLPLRAPHRPRPHISFAACLRVVRAQPAWFRSRTKHV